MKRPRLPCQDDPELFFPVGTAGPALTQAETAKALCYGCPIKVACLRHALSIGAEGIWGGTTEQERYRHPARLLIRNAQEGIPNEADTTLYRQLASA